MPLLDVRTPDEYNDAHISGAINLPLNELQGNTPFAQEILKKIRNDASTTFSANVNAGANTNPSADTTNDASLDVPIKVHCASGGRSAVACAILHNLGFTDVENLGGFNDACRCFEKGIE